MRVRNLWPTPVAEFQHHFPAQVREDLIQVLLRKNEDHKKLAEKSPDFHAFMKSKGFYATSHYNLFEEASQHPEEKSILYFEQFACRAFREYLKKAFDIKEADNVKLVGRCFGNIQSFGARTMPHYHQGIDGVLVHYLDLGHGDDKEAGATARHGVHALLMLDPRPCPTYPYWEKVESITPVVGLTVITPGYLWHESNPFRFEGTRACIVVNFQVVTNTYSELHRELRF